MILKQDPVTGYWTRTEDPNIKLVGVHDINHCRRPCGIHNTPSQHPLHTFPLYWSESRGVLYRICEHGVKHPDFDGALFYYSINLGNNNIHGCDGCCGIDTYLGS
jgi:hypothetical protein